MKTLIWIGCCLFIGLINTMIKPISPIFAGIFTFIVAVVLFGFARHFCRRLDANEMNDEYRKILDEIETLHIQGKLSKADYENGKLNCYKIIQSI